MENQFNKFQSSIEDLNIESYPLEIKEAFYDFITNVPYIKSLISPNRPYAKDCPRDEEGKIIVDLTNPPIIEDTDYFRPTAIHYQKYGCMTKLRPNPNPNSEYGKWVREEVRRCWEGYVRPSDGLWITGDMYFFVNYCPILLSKLVDGKKALRVWDFPEIWEGHFLKFHYANMARNNGHHGAELSRRGSGKSYSLAAMIAKRFLLGEYRETTKEVKCLVTAYQKEYLTKDGILNKFQSYIDFCAQNTQFPSRKLRSSLQDMNWKAGYVDLDTGSQRGTLNEVIGVSSKDDESKLRGKRGVLIAIEEWGSFPNLLGLYGTLRPSVEEGDVIYGMIYAQGTSGDEDSDFAAAQEIMYNPVGYNMQEVLNVYDKEGQGRKYFVYFFPGYMNRKGCYNKDGVSDIVKALIEILLNRYKIKYNSTNLNAITKAISEIPITPQEAIIRTSKNIFPITDLNARLNEIDNNLNFFNDVYTGTLYQTKDGTIDFKPTIDVPIRDFPTKDNKVTGCLEIYEMPQKVQGEIPQERYIIGLDNYENDVSNTMSLGSMFVFDLWTDRIVAEYTGRPMFVDDLNELCRKLCLFYNAKCCYENNKKNTFAYFSKMNCLYLLADTPQYLKQKQLIKTIGYGNTSKGISALAAVKNYGFTCIRDWLLKPITTTEKIDGVEQEVTVPNLHFIKNRALLKELILFNPDINVDRIMALVQVMLYRQEKIILYQGEIHRDEEKIRADYAGNDDFFNKNYNLRNFKNLKYDQKFT